MTRRGRPDGEAGPVALEGAIAGGGPRREGPGGERPAGEAPGGERPGRDSPGGEAYGGGVPGVTPGTPILLDEVREALDRGRPVVALESSVLAQGLPIPANREAEARMAGAIRRAGAVPAVTAVIAGQVRVGLDAEATALLLRREGVGKVSARDLPVVVARRTHGATTVAATLAISRAAGLRVLATGGIGGVHLEPLFDESPDLGELARTPMVVVCSGAKSVLDLPATFERLETLGVTAVGFGTNEVPGFFTTGTGIPLPARAESAEEVVALFEACRALGLPGALLVLNPLPHGDALPRAVVDRAIGEAIAEARREGVLGPAITPCLLAAVERATAGASLQANLRLLERNAVLAAEIAVVMSRHEAGRGR